MCNTKWRLQSAFLTQFKTKLKLRLPLVALLSVLLCFCLTLLCSYLNAHLEVSREAKPVFIRLAFSWCSSRYQLVAGWHVPLLCKVEGRSMCEWKHEQEWSSSNFDNVNCPRLHPVKGGAWATSVRWWDIPGTRHSFMALVTHIPHAWLFWINAWIAKYS